MKELVKKTSKPLANAVVSSLIPVYTWPWAALINVLSINSNKHYSLQLPGTVLRLSGSILSQTTNTTSQQITEVRTFHTDKREQTAV